MKMKFNNKEPLTHSEEEMILSLLKVFCEMEGVPFNKDLKYSRDFIGLILDLAKDDSTNVRGAGKFLKINEEIYNSPNYSPETADYLFKTYCHIQREIMKKQYALSWK